MKRFTNRLSPATAIACIALFVSLGGVSYGVATGSIDSREIKNNTVRSKDIRNSQVYSKDVRNGQILTQDIRNSTVRGNDVRNNTLTGADILESSLGKVPSASSADNANTLGGQPASAFASGGETTPFSFTTGEGDRTIANIGPFRVFSRCDLDNAGNDTGQLLLDTSADNSTMDDNNGDEFSDFDAADSPAELFANSATADSTEFESTDSGAGVIAAAPDGAALATTNEGVGFNLFGQGDSCYFGGVIVRLG